MSNAILTRIGARHLVASVSRRYSTASPAEFVLYEHAIAFLDKEGIAGCEYQSPDGTHICHDDAVHSGRRQLRRRYCKAHTPTEG